MSQITTCHFSTRVYPKGIGVRSNSDTQAWGLDLVGNWDTFTDNGVGETRTGSDAHEIDSITGGANAGSLSHDAKGNLTANAKGDSYTWDIDNHLSHAEDSLATTLGDYEYDALGRRVSKDDGTTKTVYFCLAKSPSYGFTPGQVIAEYENGTLAREYVYGTYIDEVLAKVEGGSTLYYHTNRKYDVAGLTDGTGAIVELYAYTPYGSPTVLDNTGTDIGSTAQSNVLMYTGRRLDAETGLWYFRARYMDSELGRFISRDPIGYADGLNLYAAYFAMMMEMDPTGLSLWKTLYKLAEKSPKAAELLKIFAKLKSHVKDQQDAVKRMNKLKADLCSTKKKKKREKILAELEEEEKKFKGHQKDIGQMRNELSKNGMPLDDADWTSISGALALGVIAPMSAEMSGIPGTTNWDLGLGISWDVLNALDPFCISDFVQWCTSK